MSLLNANLDGVHVTKLELRQRPSILHMSLAVVCPEPVLYDTYSRPEHNIAYAAPPSCGEFISTELNTVKPNLDYDALNELKVSFIIIQLVIVVTLGAPFVVELNR